MAKLTILLLVSAVLDLSNTTPLLEAQFLPLERSLEANSDSECPTGWFKHGHRCFTYIGTKRTWAESEQYCAFQENHFIQEMIRRQTHDFPRAWIGEQDATQERLWLWSDGSRFYYRDWSNGHPDNKRGNENCMHINYGEEKRWNDYVCSATLPSVCSMKL
uniref:C-type lectin domain-containing protein n=1 Tax=Hucho hucho TaxID=62062 RepID=A0A4W5R097_9TELE